VERRALPSCEGRRRVPRSIRLELCGDDYLRCSYGDFEKTDFPKAQATRLPPQLLGRQNRFGGGSDDLGEARAAALRILPRLGIQVDCSA
jgi:hypothetical protein